MKKFSVRNDSMMFGNKGEILQIGVVPGKFATKQILLCVLAMMASSCENIRFVRTLEQEQLAKCNLFITDAFATAFPSIPVYNNIDVLWKEKHRDIIENIGVQVPPEYVFENTKSELTKLENFDILMKYNEYNISSKYNEENKGFEKAIKLAYELIKTTLYSVASEYMYVPTLNLEIENANSEILELPFNSNWKNALKNHPMADQIKFVIVPEGKKLYRVECVNQDLDVRKLVRGYGNLISSTKFFAKVALIEYAYELIAKISYATKQQVVGTKRKVVAKKKVVTKQKGIKKKQQLIATKQKDHEIKQQGVA